MKLGIISLLILSISPSVLAQKTLVSEIEVGDLWLRADYSSVSTDLSIAEKGSSDSIDSTNESDSISVSAIKAFNVDAGAIPLIEFGIGSVDDDGNSSNVYSAKLGAKFIPSDGTNLIIFAGYSGSSDGDVQRPEAVAGALFGLQEKDFYNELSVSMSKPKKTSTLDGGNTIDLLNSIKFTPVQNFVITGIVGLSVVSDITLYNDVKLSSDPILSFGGEAELFFNDKISAALSIIKGFGGADSEIQNTEIEMDMDSTVAQISLNARF